MTASSNRTSNRWAAALFVAAALLAPSLAGADPSAAPAASVHIKDLAFVPKVLHVKVGTTVTWTNDDDVNHTVTSGTSSDDGVWTSSPPIAGGKTFSHTFDKAGTFPYYCKPHFYNEAMHATVVVDE